MAGVRPYGTLSRLFGGNKSSGSPVPHGAYPMSGAAPTVLTGVLATPGDGQAFFDWTGGGISTGGNPIWIASTTYAPTGGIRSFINGSQVVYTAPYYGTITVTGLNNGQTYTFYVWVSDDFGDGPAVSVTVTPQFGL